METFCASCKKYTESKIQMLEKLKKNRLMPLSSCGKKTSTFIKSKELHNFD